MSNDTLNDTFALFFGEPDSVNSCTDCGSEKNLEVLYTTEAGTTVWVCQGCQAKRQADQKASEQREADRMAAWDAMNEWEEG